MNRKQRPGIKWFYIPFIIVITVLLFLIAIVLFPYFFFRCLPIYQAVVLQPLYWVTWKDIKKKTGCGTNRVLEGLFFLADSGSSGVIDCRLRPEEDLVRLEKFLGMKRPKSSSPVTNEHAMFFEYRRKVRGGRPRKTPRLQFPFLKPVFAET